SRLTSQPTGVLRRAVVIIERLERLAFIPYYAGITQSVVSIFSLFRIVKEHNTSQPTVSGTL
ncbi:hypothetical protein, partial [Pantoea sp. YU22]|uniref:hypothetical protein n=1 Tax=Pantoea sp. YU22 TaxID=2497684 RepID=UPI002892DE44